MLSRKADERKPLTCGAARCAWRGRRTTPGREVIENRHSHFRTYYKSNDVTKSHKLLVDPPFRPLKEAQLKHS